MDNGNRDLIDAGALWSTEAKSGIKYWSGNLNFSTMIDGLLDQAEGSSPEKKAMAKERVEGVIGEMLDEKGDLGLLMFINNKRRPDENDPHLQLKVKVKVEKQTEPVAEDDVPPF